MCQEESCAEKEQSRQRKENERACGALGRTKSRRHRGRPSPGRLRDCMPYKRIWIYLRDCGETLNNLKSEIIPFTFRRLLTDSVEDELEGHEIKGRKLMQFHR